MFGKDSNKQRDKARAILQYSQVNILLYLEIDLCFSGTVAFRAFTKNAQLQVSLMSKNVIIISKICHLLTSGQK